MFARRMPATLILAGALVLGAGGLRRRHDVRNDAGGDGRGFPALAGRDYRRGPAS